MCVLKTLGIATKKGLNFEWGRYGRFKYVYPKETAAEMKDFIRGQISESFKDAVIDYFT